MTRAQLKSSRALWRRRELSRLKKLTAAKHLNHAADVARYTKLYNEARDARVARDKQLAALKPEYAHEIDDEGTEFIMEFEGGRGKDGLYHPYWDSIGRVWTQGIGETKGVTATSKPWTKAEAVAKFKVRINRDYIPYVLSANSKLTQNELNGFASFVWNCGVGAVGVKSRAGIFLRLGKKYSAAKAILAWNKGGNPPVVIPGLDRRRKAEFALIRRGK